MQLIKHGHGNFTLLETIEKHDASGNVERYNGTRVTFHADKDKNIRVFRGSMMISAADIAKYI